MTTLSAQNLHVHIGGKQVLDGVSLSLSRGQVTVIAGPNGAGKSTLLNCLAGLRAPDTGVVKLEEANLSVIPARRRAQRVGFLPQVPEIAWAVDVRTYVGLGRTPYIGGRGLAEPDRAAVESALEQTGTLVFADRVVTSLSGGERARVLIARALAGQPDWLLADEPFAGLDPGYQLDVAAMFGALAKRGVGVVVTVHDLQMAQRLADRVIVLHGGRVLADDAPAKALTPAILAQVYGIEARSIPGTSDPIIEIIGRTPNRSPSP
ncbi:MAG: ABC transporter ATP-binding protein [Rhodobacteraceae bacterium]|nr:ABC transporter ATP-binding protein [Paracoccaceae bacterium]